MFQFIFTNRVVILASQEPPKIQEPIKKQEPIGSNRPREPKPISRPSTNIAGMHCATESAMGPLMTMPLRKYSKVCHCCAQSNAISLADDRYSVACYI